MVTYFVSYRTADVPWAAGLLADVLAERVGRDEIFLDADAIRPGHPYPAEIRRALGSCSTMFVIIGPRWLARRSNGTRPIDDTRDYVRLEVVTGLSRGIAVVPVLVDSAPLPAAADLPREIRRLATRQALTLSSGRIEDVRRLVDRVVRPRDPEPDRASGMTAEFHGPTRIGVVGFNYGPVDNSGDGAE